MEAVEVELIYDVARLEERLIFKALRRVGLEAALTNVKSVPIGWESPGVSLSIIRPVSMHRALYAASIREAVGVPTVNRSSTILFSGDKVLTLSMLRRHGVRFPESYVAFTVEAAEKALEKIGTPAVDKPPVGSWGRLVSLIRDEETLRSLVEHREMLPSQVARTHIIQRYVDGGRTDYRVLVLGGEILGAMERSAREGEWRSNVARGGRIRGVKPDPEMMELAAKAAEILGGEFVAVDLLKDDGGYMVNEVNGVPEFKGFMEATQVDVPLRLAEHVKTVLRR